MIDFVEEKGQPEVPADWYACAQELLTPYVAPIWKDRGPHTARLKYTEIPDMPVIKFVKGGK